MNARTRFRCSVALAGIAVGILWPRLAGAATTPPPPPKFYGFVDRFRFNCFLESGKEPAITNMDAAGDGSLCLVGACIGTAVYGLDANIGPPGRKGLRRIVGGKWAKVDNTPPTHIVAVDPDTTNLVGRVTFRPGKWMVLSGAGAMYHVNKNGPPPFLPPGTPCATSWKFVGQRRNSPPRQPPPSTWVLIRIGYYGQAEDLTPLSPSESALTANATQPGWVEIKPCAKQTTCFGAPGSNRADLLVRVVPLGGGVQTPAWLPLTTAGVEVWTRQAGEDDEDARAWFIPAATDELDRPGFLDLLGYSPSNAATASDEPAESAGAALVELDPDRTNTVSEAGPPPPSGPWLTTSNLPGFRFQALLDGAPLVKAKACPAQTLCFAKTTKGAPELVARILAKQKNGKRWPVLGKFANPAAEVWIEQIASAKVRYYELIAREADDPELPGVVDRAGFAP